MKNLTTFAVILMATAGAAAADVSMSLAIELDDADSVSSITYDCGDAGEMAVTYVNAGANSLALMEIDDEDRIFVNVVAGSGAQYVSGADVWWSKGDSATLENELTGNGLQTCEAQDVQPTE